MWIAFARQTRMNLLLGFGGEQRIAIRAAGILIQRRGLLGGIALHDGLVAGFSGMDQAHMMPEGQKENGGNIFSWVYLDSMVEMMLTGPSRPEGRSAWSFLI